MALLGAAVLFVGTGFLNAVDPGLVTILSRELPRAAADETPPTTSPPPPFVVPDRPDGWFQPSGRNQGTEGIVNFLADLAQHDNPDLYRSECWGRTTGPATSDHHISRTDSWACDLAVRGVSQPTPATTMAAARISTALGAGGWAGGDLTKTINGYRVQVLWLVAGHFDHVHVGVRKIA